MADAESATVLRRYRERVRVTMTWEIEADLEDTATCIGWLADAGALLDGCREQEAQKVSIERIEAQEAS